MSDIIASGQPSETNSSTETERAPRPDEPLTNPSGIILPSQQEASAADPLNPPAPEATPSAPTPTTAAELPLTSAAPVKPTPETERPPHSDASQATTSTTTPVSTAETPLAATVPVKPATSPPAAAKPAVAAAPAFNTDVLQSCTSRFTVKAWNLYRAYQRDADCIERIPVRASIVSRTAEGLRDIQDQLKTAGVSEMSLLQDRLEFTGTFAQIQTVIKHPQTAQLDAAKA